MHGYCYRGVPEPAHGPLDTSPCPGGLTLQYHRASLSLGEYQAYADLFFRIYCVPPEECVRVRDYDTSGPCRSASTATSPSRRRASCPLLVVVSARVA